MIPLDIIDYIHELPAPNNLELRLHDAWTWKHVEKSAYTYLLEWILYTGFLNKIKIGMLIVT